MQLFSTIVVCLVWATAYGQECSQPVQFLATDNPGKILTTFTTLDANGVQNCASLCYKHPFCQAAGYSMVGSRPVCILSYGKETCSKGPYVTTADVKTGDTLLLSCIKCPTDKDSQTPLPSQKPAVTSGPVRITSGNESVEVAGGITVANASQQQSQPVKTVTDGCSYNRYAATGVKYLPGSTTGPPTTVGLITGEKSFLTESYCVQRCNAIESCTGVVYDVGYMTVGFATCQLLTPPVQMFTYKPDSNKPDSTLTYIDNIQCGQQTKYFCTYEMEPVVGLYPAFMYLVNSDTFKTTSSHMCATMCHFSANCNFAVMEVNSHNCYLISHNSSSPVRGMTSPTQPTTDPTVKMLNATGNYYLFSNVSCPSQMYTGGIPKLSPSAVCNYKTVENVEPTKLLNIDLFPLAVITTVDTAQMCSAYCFYDYRCKSALFAEKPEGQEALGKAVSNAFMYHPATTKCVLMGFNYEEFMNVPIAGVAGQNEIPKGNTGVSLLHSLVDCDGTSRKSSCKTSVVNGTASVGVNLPSGGVTPVVGRMESFFFPIFGPSECDQTCVKLGSCKSAQFHVDKTNFVCLTYDTDYPANFNMTSTAADVPTVLARTKISC